MLRSFSGMKNLDFIEEERHLPSSYHERGSNSQFGENGRSAIDRNIKIASFKLLLLKYEYKKTAEVPLIFFLVSLW